MRECMTNTRTPEAVVLYSWMWTVLIYEHPEQFLYIRHLIFMNVDANTWSSVTEHPEQFFFWRLLHVTFCHFFAISWTVLHSFSQSVLRPSLTVYKTKTQKWTFAFVFSSFGFSDLTVCKTKTCRPRRILRVLVHPSFVQSEAASHVSPSLPHEKPLRHGAINGVFRHLMEPLNREHWLIAQLEYGGHSGTSICYQTTINHSENVFLCSWAWWWAWRIDHIRPQNDFSCEYRGALLIFNIQRVGCYVGLAQNGLQQP